MPRTTCLTFGDRLRIYMNKLWKLESYNDYKLESYNDYNHTIKHFRAFVLLVVHFVPIVCLIISVPGNMVRRG